MIAILAAAAFVGLFALWVVLPRFVLRRNESRGSGIVQMGNEEFAPQAAD